MPHSHSDARNGEAGHRAAPSSMIERTHHFRTPGGPSVDSLAHNLDAAVTDAPAALTSATPTVQCSFAQMRLRVGDQLHLDLPSMVSHKKYSVTLVGWLEGQSVIVTAPRSANVSRIVHSGDTVVLRTFAGMNVYAFQANILLTPTSPFQYLHLSFPQRVDSVAIRSAVRCRLHLPITLTTGSKASDGAILNIGANGALIESHHALEKGGDVSLVTAFELHGVPVTLELAGEVRSVKPAGLLKNAPAQYGIQFLNLKPKDRLILGSLVSKHIQDDPESAA